MAAMFPTTMATMLTTFVEDRGGTSFVEIRIPYSVSLARVPECAELRAQRKKVNGWDNQHAQ